MAFKVQKTFEESLVGKAAREAIEFIVVMIDISASVIEKDGLVFINSGEADGL